MCLLFFIEFVFFTILYPFENYEKCFLFRIKSSFCSPDIQIFVFSSSSLFFPVSHCIRVWFKRNPKVYDVIICQNKNLITHFVWYLGKKNKVWHWNFVHWLSIKWGTFLWKNHAENLHQKLARDPFLILLNNPKKPLHARNSFLNKIFWKRILKEPEKS